MRRTSRLAGLVLLTACALPTRAADPQRGSSNVLSEIVDAYRASPEYRLERIRIPEIRLVDVPFSNAIARLNMLVRQADPDAPSVRIACEPVRLVLPAGDPAFDGVVNAHAERFRANDAAWRSAIASNLGVRVTFERRNVSGLRVLQACCKAADLLYSDDGRDVVIGNVYNLAWPPVIECRIVRLDPRFFTEAPEAIADILASRMFYDGPRDWIIPVPAKGAVIVFHHPNQFGAIEAAAKRANANVEVMLDRIKMSQERPRGRTL